MSELQKISKKPSRPKVWHRQQEHILKKWSEIGSSYRFMHDRAYIKFEKKNLRFALPVIIISTVTGTANFAQNSFPSEWESFIPLIIGFFNLLAGLITTIGQFLRVSELLEGHRAATIAYSKFSRNIAVELSLPREERNVDGSEFINNSRSELDRLIEQSPNIPMDILHKFGKKFDNDGFTKPDILKITPVDIYIDDEKEKLEKEVEALKKAEEMRRELMNTEKLRRETFMEEFKQKKDIEMQQQLKKIEDNKRIKKEAVNANSINAGLSKLMDRLTLAETNNDIVTPTSSEPTGSEGDGSEPTNSPKNFKILINTQKETDKTETKKTEETTKIDISGNE